MGRQAMSGDELRRWREAHGLSQSELARYLDVHNQQVYRWEKGMAPITHPNMVRLALRQLHQDLSQPAE